MDEQDDSWVALLTTAMALTVAGVALLEGAVWYVQYSVLGLALLLAIFAMSRGTAPSPSS
ncbi:hypothetical protein [Natrinema sp. 74]|uniref:hypothetical protein n=1 Tax=Natrinema sp. 74 TaxID=3384159 RepID=UPI0038D4614D